MKLKTAIKPRMDGTVISEGLDGSIDVFKPDADGELCADVAHAATAALLLNTGNFWPADPADYDQALELTGKLPEPIDAEEELPPGDDIPPTADDEVPNGGMPVELNTPPKGGKKTNKAT